MEAVLNEQRAKLGLGPLPSGLSTADAFRSDALHIIMTTRAFEFPRQNLPASIKFVGPLLPVFDEDSFQPPVWWDELTSHPREHVVHITQGTIATEAGNLIRPAIHALSSQPDLLVIVTGKDIEDLFKRDDPKSGEKIIDDGKGTGKVIPRPANVRVAAFVPHAKLLPHVGVMVTNAGYGGVLAALSCGVPLVCAGRTEDKADVSSRVAWSGAGVDLRTDTPSEKAIRDAVLKVMKEDRYRRAAGRIKDDFAEHNGPAEAANELERVVKEAKNALVNRDTV